MNKSEFIGLVKEKGCFKTNTEAETAIKAFTEAVTSALASKEEVSLVGFGIFESVHQKGKSGTVPGTDKTYVTEDKMAPKFKAGKTLKDSVAAGK